MKNGVKYFKNLLIIGAITLAPLSLFSCGEASIPYLKVDATNNLIELNVNDSKVIKLDTNINEIEVSYSQDGLIDATIANKELTIKSFSEVGSLTLTLKNKANNGQFVDLLVSIDRKSASNSLTILDDFNKSFSVGEEVNFSFLDVYLEEKMSADNTNLTLLEKDEYYFSIPTNAVYQKAGEYECTIYAPSYNVTPFTFKFNVYDDELALIKNAFEKLSESNNYTLSYSTIGSELINIDATQIFNENYYINTYNDNAIAKDETGIFKFNLESKDNKKEVVTSNGYFKDGTSYVNDLYGIVETIYGTKGLKTLNYDEIEESAFSGVYELNTASDKALFWNDTIGFNGGANKMYFSYKDEAISFLVKGALSNGTALNFIGTISNINSTKEETIDNYLTSSHKVNESVLASLSNFKKTLNNMNYTIELSSSNSVKLTSKYIEIGNSGLIELKDGVYSYTVEGDKLVLGNKSSDLTKISESLYNLNNYLIFSDDNLASFFTSSYFDSDISFNKSYTEETFQLFNGLKGNEGEGIGIKENANKSVDINIVYRKSGQLGMGSVNIKDIGSTKSMAAESYLSSL